MNSRICLAIIACFVLAICGCLERAAKAVVIDTASSALADAKKSESVAQQKADAALDLVSKEHEHYDDLRGQVLAAGLKIKDGEAQAKKLQQAADLAPLKSILHVTEALCLLAILLGIADVVACMVWTLPLGKGVGEGLAGIGGAVLVGCFLLDGVLDHIKALCAIVIGALAIYGYVVYHRAHKTVTARNAFAAAFHDAVTVLEQAGKGAEAEALKAKHLAGAVVADIEVVWTKLLTLLHLNKAPTVAANPSQSKPPYA